MNSRGMIFTDTKIDATPTTYIYSGIFLASCTIRSRTYTGQPKHGFSVGDCDQEKLHQKIVQEDTI